MQPDLLHALPLLLAEATSNSAGPLQNWAYLLASVLFIFGIKSMTPKDPDGFDLVFHWPVDRR